MKIYTCHFRTWSGPNLIANFLASSCSCIQNWPYRKTTCYPQRVILEEGHDLLILFWCPHSTDFFCFLSISISMCSGITFRQLVRRLWFLIRFLTLFLTLFLWLNIPGGLLFPGRCTWLRFAILLLLFTTHCSIFNTVLNVVSTLMSAWLLWALPPELCFYTVERGPGGDRQIALRSPAVHQRDDRSPCGGLPVTKGTSASHRLTSFLLYTPLDLHVIIRGESCSGRMESGRSPLGQPRFFSTKFLMVAHGSLPEGRKTPSDERMATDIRRSSAKF